jgi:hypothetical protein
MLSMPENWLLVGWARVEISYSMDEHARKLVTLWLSIRENWLIVGWANAEIRFYWYWTMFFPMSSVPLSPFPVPCLTSYVSCLKCLFLVSRSLSPILSLCSLYPIFLFRQFVVLHWVRLCSACDEIVSAYAQHAMKFVPRLLSMRWNRFRVCSACIRMSM